MNIVMRKKNYSIPFLKEFALCAENGCMTAGSIFVADGNDGIEFPTKEDGFTEFE